MSAPTSSSVVPQRRPPFWRSVSGKGVAPSPGSSGSSARPGRAPCEYASAARPESQPGLASSLPVRFSRLAIAVTLISVLAIAAILPTAWPPILDALTRAAGPRYVRSTTLVRDLFASPDTPVVRWLADLFLLSAAAVAVAIRGMRRHRRDGRHGRSRAWGAMAALLAIAAVSDRLRLGELVAALLADATGIVLGPEGAGWWVALSASATTLVALWAMLPLHDRAAPSAWCLIGVSGWAFAAAVPWLRATPRGAAALVDPAVGVAAAWLAGSAALLVALLVAARGVIREIRGERMAHGRSPAPALTAAKPARFDHAPTRAAETVAEHEEEPEGATAPPADDTRYTDGSDVEDDAISRPLSKAEKKRLRRLARMGQAA